MVSCLLTTSCQSVKKVEYKYTVPDYVFPQFPAIDREINTDGSWTITAESVDELAEFYVKYTALEKIYKHDKELFEGANK